MSWKITRRYRELRSSEVELSPAPKGGRVSFLLSFPKTYYLGMSNLGAQIIYRILKLNNVYCERSFLPEPDEEKELLVQNKPLFSLESQRPAQDFDIIGFTISYELEFLSVLRTLKLAHIPLESKDRNKPLVVAGGAMAVLNTEPMASFIDAFIIGDGEEAILELIRCYEKYAKNGKEAVLEALAYTPGFYVPSFYKDSYDSNGEFDSLTPLFPNLSFPIQRVTINDLNNYKGHTEILTPNTEFSNVFLLELARGCAYNCYFCMVGSSYSPYRIRKLDQVLEQVHLGMRHTNRIGLMGATVGNYKYIRELANELKKENVAISTASLRADNIPGELLEAIVNGGQHVITIAPETGRERLRWVVNKKISDQKIYDTVKMISGAGVEKIKLYFMIGIPGEDEEDLNAIVEMIKKSRELQKNNLRKTSKAAKAVISINPFIPKPFTEFERNSMASMSYLLKGLKFIGKALKSDKGITYTYEDPRLSAFQAFIARGDRRNANLLAKIAQQPVNNASDWFKILKFNGLSLESVNKELSSSILPWHHLRGHHLETGKKCR